MEDPRLLEKTNCPVCRKEMPVWYVSNMGLFRKRLYCSKKCCLRKYRKGDKWKKYCESGRAKESMRKYLKSGRGKEIAIKYRESDRGKENICKYCKKNKERKLELGVLCYLFGTSQVDSTTRKLIALRQAFKRNNLTSEIIKKVQQGETHYAYVRSN
jgi:hypothetical protein